MKFALAPDSFKESMTAQAAAEAMARGVQSIDPTAETLLRPMSDGGEGFCETIAAALSAPAMQTPVTDALGRPTTANLVIDGDTGFIEVARAVGLGMIAPSERDIMSSDSRGVGDLILAALDANVRHLVIGLGGSATNDGGAGMLSRLGVRLCDGVGNPVAPHPSELARVAAVDVAKLDPRLGTTDIEVACDVNNPLLGPKGASAVFGPQKGATEDQVLQLDSTLARLLDASPAFSRRAATQAGAGAAGGLGWALLGFCGARMRPGVELVAEVIGLADACRKADAVLTGEGSVDAQTLHGKTVAGVAQVAANLGVPVVIFAGRVLPDAEELLNQGVSQIICITPSGQNLEQALRNAVDNLETATARWLKAGLPT